MNSNYQIDIKEWSPEQIQDFWNKREVYRGKPFWDWIKDIVKLIDPKDTIEVGCGSGIWGACFKNYRGYDFAKERIKGNNKLSYGDIVKGINDKADLVFSSMVFLHIRPQDIEQAFNNFRNMGKNFIIIEPITYRTRNKGRHVFHHDYLRLLPECELWRVVRFKEEDIAVLVKFTDNEAIAKKQEQLNMLKRKKYDLLDNGKSSVVK